jgi:nitroreductase
MTASGLTLPAVVGALADDSTAREVFGVLGTARAIRYLRPDPVSDGYVEALVWAATRASSADNTQPWRFVAVTGQDQRQRIADAVSGFAEFSRDLAEPSDASSTRTRQAATHLQRNLATAPLLLFVCGRNDYPAAAPQERYLWSALFAATQNVVVAARALGLSAVFTMLHVANPSGVRSVLGVPPDYKIASMLAVGWPDRPAGPVARRPVQDVIFRDAWPAGVGPAAAGAGQPPADDPTARPASPT